MNEWYRKMRPIGRFGFILVVFGLADVALSLAFSKEPSGFIAGGIVLIVAGILGLVWANFRPRDGNPSAED